jgi:hypothetical protein
MPPPVPPGLEVDGSSFDIDAPMTVTVELKGPGFADRILGQGQHRVAALFGALAQIHPAEVVGIIDKTDQHTVAPRSDRPPCRLAPGQ